MLAAIELDGCIGGELDNVVAEGVPIALIRDSEGVCISNSISSESEHAVKGVRSSLTLNNVHHSNGPLNLVPAENELEGGGNASS